MDKGKWDLTVKIVVFWLCLVAAFLIGYGFGVLPR